MSLGVRLRRLVRRFVRLARSRRHVVPPSVAVGELMLREATIDDLRPLAELHVRTFNDTHLGPFGSGPTYATREWQWREKLLETDATNFVLVLATPANELVGFIWCHPTKDNPTWAARLNKIYLLREYQRRGLGRQMVAAAIERLLDGSLTSMALFTEVENEAACNFYERLGGERQLDEHGKFGGMYGWPDLRQLKSRLSQVSAVMPRAATEPDDSS